VNAHAHVYFRPGNWASALFASRMARTRSRILSLSLTGSLLRRRASSAWVASKKRYSAASELHHPSLGSRTSLPAPTKKSKVRRRKPDDAGRR
jgi:hypothetical protein